MAGIVFAKFTKPTSRAETMMFSKQVVIFAEKNAKLVLDLS